MKTPSQINDLKQQLRNLLAFGYRNGGSFAHGDAVRLLKAQILVAQEERKFFA